ncbi:unnamed protein product [marine sediment metagenome]|uniref:Polymerase/histidinol phosphatase N-terminal domain-containing protein n=1 Tax=marine sediment metagenome TaxID=412755 RepID=X1TGP8_9ZZZZ
MEVVHLHVHSQYSMQDGFCSLDDLIKQATKFKMKAVALTDHDGLYGAIQFYKKNRGTELTRRRIYLPPARALWIL